MEVPVIIEPDIGNGYRANGARGLSVGLTAAGATAAEAIDRLADQVWVCVNAGAKLAELSVAGALPPGCKTQDTSAPIPCISLELAVCAPRRSGLFLGCHGSQLVVHGRPGSNDRTFAALRRIAKPLRPPSAARAVKPNTIADGSGTMICIPFPLFQRLEISFVLSARFQIAISSRLPSTS